MLAEIPDSALAFGFTNGPGGTHTSRTIMLSELRLLLSACSSGASFEEYRAAILKDNVLLKRTLTTRMRSLRALREIYSLHRDCFIFGILHDLWDTDVQAQPLLAMLCAVARDPVLRATSGSILTITLDTEITPRMISHGIGEAFPDRYNERILHKIGRNAASSWQQSGHLRGRARKFRQQAHCRPAAVAYGLLLGYLCGKRGEALLNTLWAQLLDSPIHVLRDHAIQASQNGWIEYRRSGDVTDIGFRHFLGEER